MARNTREHVFEGMELLPEGLIPFVEKRLDSQIKGHWQVQVSERVRGLRAGSDGQVNWDQQGLLWAMVIFWKEAFSTVLGHSERSYVSELLGVRNKLSHYGTFTDDDAERALDTMWRLLEAVSAREVAEKIRAARETMLRTRYAELARNEERRKTQRPDIPVDTVAGLMPWREVVEPHQDVATGDFQQAGFAILAPVPLEHLESGQAIAEEKGFVAFGSRKWKLFRDMDERRDGNPVPVLIYASDGDGPARFTSKVSWVGWYIGREETHTGRHRLGMKHRPPTTAQYPDDNSSGLLSQIAVHPPTTAQYPDDNSGHWAVFWHVEKLSRLAAKDCFEISELQTTKGGWRKDAPPRGPVLVDVPPFVEFPE